MMKINSQISKYSSIFHSESSKQTLDIARFKLQKNEENKIDQKLLVEHISQKIVQNGSNLQLTSVRISERILLSQAFPYGLTHYIFIKKVLTNVQITQKYLEFLFPSGSTLCQVWKSYARQCWPRMSTKTCNQH